MTSEKLRTLASTASLAALCLLQSCGNSTGALTGSFSIVGRGAVLDRFSSDLWVHGSAAYTGTWELRGLAGNALFGNVLNVWDISDPAIPQLTNSLTIDARTINDVKISSDGTLGLITHEGSNDGLNGVTLIDLTNPLQPSCSSPSWTVRRPTVCDSALDFIDLCSFVLCITL